MHNYPEKVSSNWVDWDYIFINRFRFATLLPRKCTYSRIETSAEAIIFLLHISTVADFIAVKESVLGGFALGSCTRAWSV